MVFWGYVVIFCYIFALLFLLGPLINKLSGTETSRKVIHTMLFFVWVFIDLFFKHTVHQIIIALVFLLLNSLSYKFKFYKSVERTSDNHLGTVYFAAAISVILTVAFFWRDFYYPCGIAVFCLTFGDGFAALIGYHTRSLRLRDHKTLYGTLACFAACALSLLVFNRVYAVGLSVTGILTVALAAALLELAEHGLDNFTVVAGTFLLSYGLCVGDAGRIQLAALFACGVFLIVFLTKAISYSGALLSMVIVFCFSFLGGAFSLIFLLCTYFTVFFIALIKRHVLNAPKKEKPRSFMQILINGGFGLVFMLLYGFLKDEGYLIVSIIAVSGCFIDSISSDVGVLSGKAPYDPIRRMRVTTGLSGGMSVIGTAAALICAVIIAAAVCLFFALPVTDGVIIVLIVFFQTVADTVLGSLLQAKYRCGTCQAVTEHREHCGGSAVLCSGVSWINNNAVNLISSCIITAIAAVVYLR